MAPGSGKLSGLLSAPAPGSLRMPPSITKCATWMPLGGSRVMDYAKPRRANLPMAQMAAAQPCRPSPRSGKWHIRRVGACGAPPAGTPGRRRRRSDRPLDVVRRQVDQRAAHARWFVDPRRRACALAPSVEQGGNFLLIGGVAGMNPRAGLIRECSKLVGLAGGQRDGAGPLLASNRQRALRPTGADDQRSGILASIKVSSLPGIDAGIGCSAIGRTTRHKSGTACWPHRRHLRRDLSLVLSASASSGARSTSETQHLRFTVAWHPFSSIPTCRAGRRPRPIPHNQVRQPRAPQQLDERIETAATVRLESIRSADPHNTLSLSDHPLAGQKGLQDGIVEALFEGYFCNGADIGGDRVLAKLGEGGLDRVRWNAAVERGWPPRKLRRPIAWRATPASRRAERCGHVLFSGFVPAEKWCRPSATPGTS